MSDSRIKKGGLLAVAILCFSLTVAAQNGARERTDFGKRAPTREEVISALAPLQTRTLQRESQRALNLQLRFATASADLNEDVKQQLGGVGSAMNSDALKEVGFIVEGHTDARGSEAYNKALAERRAHAVKNFLAAQYNVDAKRLRIVGVGKSALKDPAHPASEENRRVEIISVPRP